ncbi:uncharacterized protein LAJ45_09030 [Morchella importuna]|uniref:uncharacterized protein n=1 Tax=Morchella importuna TaxID=1174673 RepID=UPI001E8D3212|nr:uncharacterized protein LAJ45_09030 [Morchella importuna]KAH8146950.1 hypothetical protein LAJ45_09030 [Morchella importuna]
MRDRYLSSNWNKAASQTSCALPICVLYRIRGSRNTCYQVPLLYKHEWNPPNNHYRLILVIHRPAKINTCMHMFVLRIEAVQSQLGKDVYQPINRGNWDELKGCTEEALGELGKLFQLSALRSGNVFEEEIAWSLLRIVTAKLPIPDESQSRPSA